MEQEDQNPPDIVARTFRLGTRIDALCRHLRKNKLTPGHRVSQLERAGSSVGALVEEAQGAESKNDFIHKMSVALKEARETFYWLRQLMASNVMPSERLESLTDEARQVKLILAAIVNSARDNRDGSNQGQGDAQPDDE